MNTGLIVNVLERSGALDGLESLALPAGWVPYEKPPVDCVSDLRIQQTVRLGLTAEGAGFKDIQSAALACLPRTSRDLKIIKELAEAAEAEGDTWTAAPIDIATVMILAHSETFNSKFFIYPFRPALMKTLCNVLNMDLPLEMAS